MSPLNFYIDNLLHGSVLYDRIVYIVKKESIFFAKKGVFKWGSNFILRGAPITEMFSYANEFVL